jgi:hypothetical protein
LNYLPQEGSLILHHILPPPHYHGCLATLSSMLHRSSHYLKCIDSIDHVTSTTCISSSAKHCAALRIRQPGNHDNEEEEEYGESSFLLEEGTSKRRPRAPKQIFPFFLRSRNKELRMMMRRGRSGVECVNPGSSILQKEGNESICQSK